MKELVKLQKQYDDQEALKLNDLKGESTLK
jgi:hypothetical protein